MDLSDLVHGLKPKAQRQRDSSRSQTHPESDARHSQHHNSSTPRRTSQHSRRSIDNSTNSHRSSRQREPQQISSGSSSSSPSRDVPVASRVGNSSGSSHKLLCDLCNRTFDDKTQFDQHSSVFHRRSKVPSKPREASFVCPFCGKAFTSPSKRNVHKNATHMGLRPFQCDVCSKSFGYKGGMHSHLSIIRTLWSLPLKEHSANCYINSRFFLYALANGNLIKQT